MKLSRITILKKIFVIFLFRSINANLIIILLQGVWSIHNDIRTRDWRYAVPIPYRTVSYRDETVLDSYTALPYCRKKNNFLEVILDDMHFISLFISDVIRNPTKMKKNQLSFNLFFSSVPFENCSVEDDSNGRKYEQTVPIECPESS